MDSGLLIATLLASVGDLLVNLLMPFMTGDCQSECCGASLEHHDSVHECVSMPSPDGQSE